MKKLPLLLVLAGLTGCTDNTAALKSLEMEEESSKYDVEFWRDQASKNNKLWQDANNFCKDNITKTNCLVIAEAAAMDATSDVVEQADDMVDEATDAIDDVAEDASEVVDEVVDEVSDAADDAAEKLDEITH